MRDPPVGVKVDPDKIASNLSEYGPFNSTVFLFHYVLYQCRWTVSLTGASGTLYEGKDFVLQFKFGSRYPFDSPQVS
jgi:ubiquitin-conjugating enzyme E2 W